MFSDKLVDTMLHVGYLWHAVCLLTEISENQSPEQTLLQDLDSLSHGLKSCDQSHVSMETAAWDRVSIRHALEQHKVSCGHPDF